MKKTTQKRIESALLVVLPKGIKIRLKQDRDGTYLLKMAGQNVKVSWAQNGWLSQIESVVSQKPSLVVAQKISPGGADFLESHKMSWVDETGAAEISLENVIVSRQRRELPLKKNNKKWPKSAIVAAEIILSGYKATVQEIHRISGFSWGASMNALKYLQEEGLLTASSERGRDAARYVKDKKNLLEAYTEARMDSNRSGDVLVVGVAWTDPVLGLAKLGNKFQKNNIVWAATGMIASSMLAPIITDYGSYQVYVEAKDMTELELIAKNSDLKPLKGGRLTLIAYPRNLEGLILFRNGMQLAPWPRVYADLKMLGVRGEEAAHHLEEVMNDTK